MVSSLLPNRRLVLPVLSFCWALLVTGMPRPSSAQTAGSPPVDADTTGLFHAGSKERKISPPEVLQRFNSEPAPSYQLGFGDEITLEIWGHPELSAKHQVGPDGRITLPVIGSIQITGLTREEAASAVVNAYSNYYSNLSATVRVDRYTSNRIFVLGRVSNPGALFFDRSPTLLEAITRAGSLPVGGMGAEKAALTRCAIFRGRDQVAWIDLKALLNGGNLSLNLQLRRDDVVYIPDADDQLIYVLGEVKTPGALHLTPDMSLLDALARSGGPTDDAAKSKIHLIRPSRELNREIALDHLLEPDPNLNIALEEGDILYVPKRNIGRVGYVQIGRAHV